MSDTIQRTESESKIECYLCSLEMPFDKSMEIPLTTGGTVRVHPSCLEFYMAKTANAGGGCSGCTGGKGCC